MTTLTFVTPPPASRPDASSSSPSRATASTRCPRSTPRRRDARPRPRPLGARVLPAIPSSDLARIGAEETDPLVLVVASVRAGRVHANLLAPVLVHPETGAAVQSVLEGRGSTCGGPSSRPDLADGPSPRDHSHPGAAHGTGVAVRRRPAPCRGANRGRREAGPGACALARPPCGSVPVVVRRGRPSAPRRRSLRSRSPRRGGDRCCAGTSRVRPGAARASSRTPRRA